jgi:hypothetical protein
VPEHVSVARGRGRKEERVTTSGWLLVLERGRDVGAVRAALAGRSGIECRMEGRDMLVVVTETEFASGVEEMRRIMSSAPGVRSADLVRSFEDQPGPSRRRRPSLAPTLEPKL